MNIKELYDGYEKIENKTEENIYEYFDQNVNVQRLKVSEVLAIVRMVLSSCEKEDGDYKYIDRAMASIAFDVAIVSGLTDIDLATGDEESEESNGEAYDYISYMSLLAYFRDKYWKSMEVFDSMYYDELETYDHKYGVAAILDKHMNKISSAIAGVMSGIQNVLDNFENFDPEQLEKAQKVLENMNESVEQVRNLRVVK